MLDKGVSSKWVTKKSVGIKDPTRLTKDLATGRLALGAYRPAGDNYYE